MRPAAQEKLGFYPAPIAAIEMIADHVTAEPEAVIVDPCAGEGVAVEALAAFLHVDKSRIVAGELENTRSAALAARLPTSRVSQRTDFQSSKFAREQATLLYLNPPFDNEVGAMGDRCEATFLARATPMLKGGGVLVLIMPEQRVPSVRLLISNYYADAQKFAFPKEHRKFNEVAIIATKRHRPLVLERADYRTLEYPVPGAVYYAGPGELFEIIKQAYTQEDLAELMKVDLLSLQGHKKASRTLRPPLQLGQGHIALLLAAGHLNGRVHKEGELPHVVRGTARKVEVTKEKIVDKKETTTVTQEKIELVIRVARPDGTIEDLENA